MIEELMDTIEEYIENHSIAEHDMSAYIEDYVLNHYDEIKAENPKIARYMNDYFLDICDQTEPGLTGTNFDEDLEREYQILRQMISQTDSN